ncbi:four helix bundle protein [Okeania sp. KiyG1]|uniref:four helix bundle protein n=1 Tax=Okeania sp. KiyG1 TaxID=2720165 RepID=UPI002104F020|nr:four helix bundle protein [Okeania sp. KiyG1]
MQNKSFKFALRIVKLSQYLNQDKKEYVLSKQILRSGTAIGALVRESEYAESRADFVHQLRIAIKEANETQYWLELLHQADYINKKGFKSINQDCIEVIKILIAIIKSTTKNNY